MKLIEYFEKPLKKYCDENGIEFAKIKKFMRCGNADVLYFQYCPPGSGTLGLLDETPAEVVLKIERHKNGEYDIEEGLNLRKYLKEV